MKFSVLEQVKIRQAQVLLPAKATTYPVMVLCDLFTNYFDIKGKEQNQCPAL